MCENNQPEGLDKELYGHKCPELEWMTAEEIEDIFAEDEKQEARGDSNGLG